MDFSTLGMPRIYKSLVNFQAIFFQSGAFFKLAPNACLSIAFKSGASPLVRREPTDTTKLLLWAHYSNYAGQAAGIRH